MFQGRSARLPSRIRQRLAGGQTGQTLILFAVMLTVLVIGTGLIVDTGYAYQRHRLAQNAADAASMAAAQQLASNMSSGMSDSTMVALLNQYAAANLPGSTIGGHYVDSNGNAFKAVGSGYNPPAVTLGNAPTVAGVSVTVTDTHNTFLLRAANINTVTVKGQATATYGALYSTMLQPPSGPDVMPMAVDDQSYKDAVNADGFNKTQITFNEPITQSFSSVTQTAGFNWSPLNITTSNSDSVIKSLLAPNSPYGSDVASLGVGIDVQISPGQRDKNYQLMGDNFTGADVLIPLVDHNTVTNCPNCQAPITGFAWFHIVSAAGGSQKTIVGYWVDPRTKAPISGGHVAGGSWGINGPVTFGLMN